MNHTDIDSVAEHEIERHHKTMREIERYSSDLNPERTVDFYMAPEMLFYRFDGKKAVVDGDAEAFNETYSENASAVIDTEFDYEDFRWAYGIEDNGEICGAVAAFDERLEQDFGLINTLLGKNSKKPTIVHIFDSRSDSERVDIHIDRNRPLSIDDFLPDLNIQ